MITIQQLSIFIENKAGTLVNVLQLFKQADIQLIASTIADTVEYGICRIICSEPQRAYTMLKEHGVSVAMSEVFALELDNKPGRAADAIEIFAREGIGLTYLYSFLLNGKGVLIFRTNNAEKAKDIILKNNLQYIAEKDLSLLV